METSIFEVFEKMFYVFLEPDGVECPDYDAEALVSFSGSMNGKMSLMLSEKVTKVMVKNMLNLEEEDITDREVEDCSKEAVNMACGNFLAKLDDTERFDLSIPVFLNPPRSVLRQGDDTISLNLISDD
ncbi:MAG: chemotaxis protein CheX, partial [Sphaerochaetaceae bacterium]|nr:chemotaxis protein CheX [Sphaerochaetaceae bacterium]